MELAEKIISKYQEDGHIGNLYDSLLEIKDEDIPKEDLPIFQMILANHLYKFYNVFERTDVPTECLPILLKYAPNKSLEKRYEEYGNNIKLRQMSLSWIFFLLTGVQKSIDIPSEEIPMLIKSLPSDLDLIKKCESRHIAYLYLNYANEVDSIDHTKIDDLFSYDYVEYSSNGKVFRFSRAEFSWILSKKINPWTNEQLPDELLRDIADRNEKIKSYGYPPFGTRQKIYDRYLLMKTNISVTDIIKDCQSGKLPWNTFDLQKSTQGLMGPPGPRGPPGPMGPMGYQGSSGRRVPFGH
jgi:hypothetical protein